MTMSVPPLAAALLEDWRLVPSWSHGQPPRRTVFRRPENTDMKTPNIVVGTIASLIPVPGGNTLVAAIGLSGALVAFGVPETAAVAAVITQQLIATYLPAIPGWFATHDMLRHGLL